MDDILKQLSDGADFILNLEKAIMVLVKDEMLKKLRENPEINQDHLVIMGFFSMAAALSRTLVICEKDNGPINKAQFMVYFDEIYKHHCGEKSTLSDIIPQA